MERHGREIIYRIKTNGRRKIQAKEEMCVYTDPSMTAGGSTTTRGSSFFCVSLEQRMKVGKIRKNKIKKARSQR